MSHASNSEQLALPLVIAVTGHRDLVAAEIPLIRQRMEELFVDLKEEYPYNRLVIMSPLAEGADTIAAEVALDLEIDLLVPLPKPLDEYLADFNTEEARQKFRDLSTRARQIIELKYAIPPTPDGFEEDNWINSFPYAHLGTYLCAHCHILLAVWDGQESTKIGGTASVIRFHQDDIMPGLTPDTAAAQRMLVDDESDLVFHIPCSRDSADYAEHAGHTVEESCWYTKDKENPRSKELPAQHKLIFQRSAEFSQDAQLYAEKIEQERWSLIESEAAEKLPDGIKDIDKTYCAADWLAMFYQKKVMRTLLVTHVMAFLMGLMFLMYTDFSSVQLMLVAFLIFFTIATLSQTASKRGEWHRKYLDYRTLAEGLRVQFYWAAAGVTSKSKWKFAHDSYLQTENPEFGWIRNVMRVAGIDNDADPYVDNHGMQFTLAEWVGGEDSGQLGYFKRKGQERIERYQLNEKLGTLSLLASVASVFVFLIFGSDMSELGHSIVALVMGTTLLLYGVREGYTYANATKELIKQYEHMLRIFDNANRRLAEANTIEDKRSVLSVLGQSALDEHADWIVMQRERSLDETEIWRMGS